MVNEALSDDFNQGNYIYLSEYLSEQLYSFLLCRLCVFKHSLDEKLALWRQWTILLDKLSLKLHKFHMPEVHDRILGMLFSDIFKGNSQHR